MNIEIQKAFDFAADLVKQLITLSTGIIALTVTFSKDIFADNCAFYTDWLISAWVAYLISIICGLWALMALTGTLDPPKRQGAIKSIQGANCRLPTLLQIIAFFVGTALTIIYASKSL